MTEVHAGAIRSWREHPAQMVRDLFGIKPVREGGTLELWQESVLEAFPHSPAIALLACKGPGKTTLLAWLGWNFLLCYAHPKIAALSISGKNLRDNLWAELAKWRNKSELLKQQFEWTAERIFCRDYPETWWISARSWPQSADPQAQADTLAGLWADNVMVLMDEAGAIPRAILATASVILANSAQSGKNAHVVLAGNSNQRDSALYQAAVMERAKWFVKEITADPDDPERTLRIPIEFAREQITLHGRDNPWVMINILAQFPKQGLNALISEEEVMEAQKRHLTENQYSHFPKILGVDVARFGDDESVIFKRQGRAAFPPLRVRGLNSIQGGSHVARISDDWNADSIQIDATGGYGSGWYDVLQDLNYGHTLPVEFAGKAHQPERYYNKRAEMMWDLCEWVKGGGALPPVPEMVAGLATQTYSFKGGRILVEDKDQIKLRLGRSPDLEDALMCTFAHPVAAKRAHYPEHMGIARPILDAVRESYRSPNDYDPLAREFGDTR